MKQAEPHHTVTVVPGDGIGPEVVEAARRALNATGTPIEWDVQEAGTLVAEREGTPLPRRVIESVSRNRVALKGPLTTSTDPAYGSPNVALREALDLHTTIRPCRALEGIRGPHSRADLVIVKMNYEDLYDRIGYAGRSAEAAVLRDLIRRTTGRQIPEDAAMSIRPLSGSAARRVIKKAFEYARAHGRTRVTAVHKAPLIPETDGLFLEIAREVGEAYGDMKQDDELVDTVCERLVSRPGAYDVLVTPRMYGDILSGPGAALAGGPGMAPGVNVGGNCAVFEAAHGTAPRMHGRGRANPIAMILSGAMMLRHLGERDAGERLEAAVAKVVREGRTVSYDLKPAGGPATTKEVADAVIAAVESGDDRLAAP